MIGIICATNRNDAVSRKVALQYKELLESREMTGQVIDLADMPDDVITNALYENKGKSEGFNALMTRVKQCQQFVFIIPEYNGSFPGVLKVFIDAMPYPNYFKDKVAGLVGISSGIQGAVLAMSHFTDILNYLGMQVLAAKPKLPDISGKMEGDKIVDDASIKYLIRQIEQMSFYVKSVIAP